MSGRRSKNTSQSTDRKRKKKRRESAYFKPPEGTEITSGFPRAGTQAYVKTPAVRDLPKQPFVVRGGLPPRQAQQIQIVKGHHGKIDALARSVVTPRREPATGQKIAGTPKKELAARQKFEKASGEEFRRRYPIAEKGELRFEILEPGNEKLSKVLEAFFEQKRNRYQTSGLRRLFGEEEDE